MKKIFGLSSKLCGKIKGEKQKVNRGCKNFNSRGILKEWKIQRKNLLKR